ncbi:MAG: RNA polymerase sigma factor [Flavobacteriales bacterium]|nr:RNA polymerase sigma factor [Flavobacteriales bacterium]MCX7769191.1 RNA polymerase sigma factor [Flavobacteriales bacterium]MDW8410707.1 RNA polymerase sigma factor [Flavobacteriales bacterium]
MAPPETLHSATEKKRFLEDLVKEYGARLYSQIYRITRNHEDTDDVLQNVYLKVWIHLERFRGEAHISTWIYRIAYNETLGWLRRQKLRKALPSEWIRRFTAETPVNYEKGEALFQKALDSLPPRQRMVFHYRHFDQLSYREIAAITGLTEGALKASYHHAVHKIEKFLAEAY